MQRRFEIPDPLTQTLAEFRDFLAAEYQHRNAEDDQQLGNSETEGHNNLQDSILAYCNPENRKKAKMVNGARGLSGVFGVEYEP
jgi:hypothetical protein